MTSEQNIIVIQEQPRIENKVVNSWKDYINKIVITSLFVTSESNETVTNNRKDIQTEKKRLQKKKQKKKQEETSFAYLKQILDEQTKQIKRIADNKMTEIEEIGRGNRMEN